jgi:hypothetical protein
MSYPSYNQLLGSSADFVDDRQIDQDVDGEVHVRSFFASRKSHFVVKHALTRAEYQDLLDFYDANRLTSFTFTWNLDGADYTVLFMTPPKCDTSLGTRLSVSVELRQVS